MERSSADGTSASDPCMTCGYELMALPDGLCPECGTVFTHAGNEQARERLKVSAISAATVRFLLSCFVAAIFAIATGVLSAALSSYRDYSGTALAVSLCPLLGMGFTELLRTDASKPTSVWRARLELIGALLLAAIIAATNGWLGAGMAGGVISAGVTQLCSALHVRRWFLLFALPAAGLLALGGGTFVQSQARIAAGYRFSEWNNEYLSAVEPTWAMSNIRARALSVRTLQVGGTLAIAACIVAGATRQRTRKDGVNDHMSAT